MKEFEPAGDQGDVPQPDWTPEQLGQFVHDASRKRAILVHRIGVALNLAKSKLLHGAWEEWLAKYCPDLKATTLRRYMRLAKTYTEEQLKEMPLGEAYAAMAKKGKAAAKKLHDPEPLVKNPGENETGTAASEPAKDPGDESTAEDEDDSLGVVVLPRAVSRRKLPVVRREIEDAFVGREDFTDEDLIEEDEEPDTMARIVDVLKQVIPYRLTKLSEDIAWVRQQEPDLRQSCWLKVDLEEMTDKIKTLSADLNWLNTDMAV